MSFFRLFYGKTSETTYQAPIIDPTTHGLVALDWVHHETHEGDLFQYYDAITLASAATQDYLITTPNTTTWAHMRFTLDGLAVTKFELFEASDKTGTTLQTAYCSNRNSSNVYTITIHKGTSGGSTVGTKIKIYSSGSSSGSSKTMSSATGGEIILKQNTKYILRATSGTADNLINVKLEWYEHTNKTA